jgi:hypothetical protein
MIRRSGNRFADKIMRHFKMLAREPRIGSRNLRKLDRALRPESESARTRRALSVGMSKRHA